MFGCVLLYSSTIAKNGWPVTTPVPERSVMTSFSPVPAVAGAADVPPRRTCDGAADGAVVAAGVAEHAATTNPTTASTATVRLIWFLLTRRPATPG